MLTSHHSHHAEDHFTSNETVRDIVIGMADGLTVPFALAAGLSGAVIANSIIVTAGLAEIAAGAIAMGLGGYLAARGDLEHFVNERRREEEEIIEFPDVEKAEVAGIFQSFGLTEAESIPVVESLSRRPKAWVDFMMRFELGLEEPQKGRAWKSALTIGVSYALGGLFPLAPYMLLSEATLALRVSIVATMLALFIFGYVKGKFSGSQPFRSALQTVCIGGLAAAAAYFIASRIRG